MRDIELLQHTACDEPCAGSEQMTITALGQLGDVELQRHAEGQLVLRAGHRDVEEPPFFFDICRLAGAEIGGYTAIDGIQHEHGFPFLAFGRMDGRQDQVVFFLQVHPRLGTGSVWRIERDVGQELVA